jgi:energy-coupling factor transporter ATP-binding protein EcfA2
MNAAAFGENPFPGLRRFDADDADHPFFGREEQVDQLLVRLRKAQFLALIGTSGSGKSSLIRAGLLPALHGGTMAGAGSHWRTAILTPENKPLANLARALAAPDVLGAALPPDIDEDAQKRYVDFQAALIGATLDGGARGLVEAVLGASLPDGENVLVLVDQFEELFRFAGGSGERGRESPAAVDEAAAFVKLLLEAASDPDVPVYIALTMRSDFLGDCARFRDLPEKINEGLFLVPRMTRDQLQRAIEGPVHVANAEISPALVTRLLNDVGDDPDQLPILQHALMRTWDLWVKGGRPDVPLGVDHYAATGGLASALNDHADEIYRDLSPEVQTTVERLFKCLTLSDRGEDSWGIRRPTAFADALAIVGVDEAELFEALRAFNAPGRSLLMPPDGTPMSGDTRLDITHESLMRVWKKLQQWVRDEAESARLYRRLADDANRGASHWREADLAVGLEWLAENRDRINEAWAKQYVA